MKVDRTGQTCSECGQGTYQETSLQDDWTGHLHCVHCNHCVKRWAEPAENQRVTQPKNQQVTRSKNQRVTSKKKLSIVEF